MADDVADSGLSLSHISLTASSEEPVGSEPPCGVHYPGLVKPLSAPTSDDYERTERRVGFPLPDDYRRFIDQFNGCAPKRTHVDGFWVECFNHVREEKYECDRSRYYNIEKASEWPSEDLGEEVVAIAGDGCGDALIFRRCRRGSQGPQCHIQWWYHDEDRQDDVCDTFTQLLELLKDPPPE
eukprot:TRINITY_DN12666_c0_g1_i1.p1 TRINITY_DN12666_c0_g1~~TRINITY_DN12666_c0_g1_i1.p1  ORF type:complete len:182 (+),score=14.45 TRINITY_DN12666_c0_g1_i1:143-688(+)